MSEYFFDKINNSTTLTDKDQYNKIKDLNTKYNLDNNVEVVNESMPPEILKLINEASENIFDFNNNSKILQRLAFNLKARYKEVNYFTEFKEDTVKAYIFVDNYELLYKTTH